MPSIHAFLTDEEWDAINSEVPDIRSVVNRINEFPYAEWIDMSLSDLGMNKLECLRLSRVCLHDASEDIRGSRFALGNTVGVRKFYGEGRDTEKSEIESAALADFYGRFYAEYVPLLLYSAAKDTLDAVYYLYDLKPKNSSDAALDWLLNDHRGVLQSELVNSLKVFAESPARRQVWAYRHGWVHSQAPIIESPLYRPPRISGVERQLPWPMAGLGYSVQPRYSWDTFLGVLFDGLSTSLALLDVVASEWSRHYQEYVKDTPP